MQLRGPGPICVGGQVHQRFLTEGSLPPGNIRQDLQTFLVVTLAEKGDGEGEGATGTWGQSPGMLLNILHHMGQSPQQRIIQPKVPTVLRLRNPDVYYAKVPLQATSYCISTATPKGRYYWYCFSYFTDESTEVKRGEVIPQGHRTRRWLTVI